MKFLYTCFTYVYVVPLSIVAFALALVGRGEHLERLGLRLPKLRSGQRAVWLVASSVGEVTIALKLCERFKQNSATPVILSVTTPTGRNRAQQSASGPDLVMYHPFDTRRVIGKFLRAYNPQILALVETELWPCLMECALEQGIKVVQVSGRISLRSSRHYHALRPIFGPVLQRSTALLVQSSDDAERLALLADDTLPIEVIGSIKEDYVPPAEQQMTEVRKRLMGWKDATIFVCGSTRPGEEAVILDAYSQVQSEFPDLRVIIAPRHLERTGEIEMLLKEKEPSYSKWSNGTPERDTKVFLLDTIGMLNAAYHAGDIAFVGGTIAPIGGHNLLEPALAGLPVLYGPHYFQQEKGQALIAKYQMAYQVESAHDMARTIREILVMENYKSQFLSRGQGLRKASSHILDEYVGRLQSLIENE